jgi:hypothetical protein
MPSATDPMDDATLDQIHSMLFQQLVVGHSQMALMLMGRLENPHSGEFESVQPEGAKVFIDQLEMLQAKTRGNLSPEESEALTRALGAVHTAFAEILNDPH